MLKIIGQNSLSPQENINITSFKPFEYNRILNEKLYILVRLPTCNVSLIRPTIMKYKKKSSMK
jgi:hypothetical protein